MMFAIVQSLVWAEPKLVVKKEGIDTEQTDGRRYFHA